MHCKYAVSAGHNQTGKCGDPAPAVWGLISGGGHPQSKKSVGKAGTVNVCVAMRSPSSAH